MQKLFCGLANLALHFQWFRRFRRFWKHLFLQKRGATPKNTKMMMGAAPEIYFALFSETPILTFMLAIRDRQCKKPIFPAVLGIFAHPQTKAGFTPYPNQKKMPYIKSKKLCFEQPHFRHDAPRSRPIFCAPARITGPGLPPPPRNTAKIGISDPRLSAPHF